MPLNPCRAVPCPGPGSMPRDAFPWARRFLRLPGRGGRPRPAPVDRVSIKSRGRPATGTPGVQSASHSDQETREIRPGSEALARGLGARRGLAELVVDLLDDVAARVDDHRHAGLGIAAFQLGLL